MNTDRGRETRLTPALTQSALFPLSRILRNTHTQARTVRIISVACVCVCIMHFKVMRNLLRQANFASSLSLFLSLTLSLLVTLTVTVLWLQMNHLLSVSGTSLEASSRGSDSGSDNRLAAPHQSQSEIGLLRLLASPACFALATNVSTLT